MRSQDRYPLALALRNVCRALKISPERVVRRAGLPADFLPNEGKGVTPRQFFDVWNGIVDEAKRPDLPIFLGQAYARGPFNPPLFAFSCSPNIEIGLKRLALFKPLMGPIGLSVHRSQGALEVTFSSVDPDARMPDSLAAFEIVYFLECSRIFTAEHIVPLGIGMTVLGNQQQALDEYFGVKAEKTQLPTIVMSIEDVKRPLVSENAELWSEFEKGLRRQLADRDRQTPMALRVKNVLLELLPSGRSSAEAVCDRLHLSKRSLQRHLHAEGQPFQRVLDATRSELSLYYLSRDDLSVEEISYLLAYRDPNSFYRAFHGWTGMTPMEARGQRQH